MLKYLLKVKNIYYQLEDLSIQIGADRKRWYKIGEPLVFSVYNIYNNVEKSSININGNFLYSELLIRLLLQLKSNDENRKEFIDLCKKEYANDENAINDFEKNYEDEYAVWWYTRDIFLFRKLNKALRLQDIDWLFHFRFFIQDMYKVLKELQDEQRDLTSPVVVYRAQLISSNELVQLKNSIGGLIPFNSFLSTSRSRQYTLFALGTDPKPFGQLNPILFEIKADNQINNKIKPYADVSAMSALAAVEQETLFMIGSIFRLESITTEGYITVFHLSLCSENDHDLIDLFEHMKKEFEINDDSSLLTVGTLLWKSGRFDHAENFYRRMLNEIDAQDSLIPNCYQGLGFVAAAKGDLENALIWQTKVLDYDRKSFPPDDYRIGCDLNTIGNVHWRAENYPLAIESYLKAIKIFGQHHDRYLSASLNNLGNVYEERGQIDDALKYHRKALDIRQSILPPNHPDVATSYHNLANVYRKLGRLDLARSHIKQALKIFQKSLRSNDPTIGTVYQTMAAIELDSGAYRQGLSDLEQAAAIFRETLPETHPTVETIHTNIMQTMMKMSGLGLNFL